MKKVAALGFADVPRLTKRRTAMLAIIVLSVLAAGESYTAAQSLGGLLNAAGTGSPSDYAWECRKAGGKVSQTKDSVSCALRLQVNPGTLKATVHYRHGRTQKMVQVFRYKNVSGTRAFNAAVADQVSKYGEPFRRTDKYAMWRDKSSDGFVITEFHRIKNGYKATISLPY